MKPQLSSILEPLNPREGFLEAEVHHSTTVVAPGDADAVVSGQLKTSGKGVSDVEVMK